MKLQAKSLLSSLSQTVTPKAQSAEAVSGNRLRPVELKTVANLQALAAELRLFATEGTFEYPRNWVQIAGVAAILFMGVALSRLLVLALPVLQSLSMGIPLSSIELSPWALASAALGVILSFAFAAT